jgi:OmcA/MtrC family decaheme c-type cytochrome
MDNKFLSIMRWGAIALIAGTLSACGGDSDSTTTPTPPPSTGGSVDLTAGDTSGNPNAAFTAISGTSLVTVNSPPKVRFTVIDNGAVKTGLTTSNVSFIIAKLEPGVSGNPDQFHSYTYRLQTGTTGPSGTPVLAEAMQATTDPKTSPSQLQFDSATGIYTYTFSTDITDPTKTNGVVFEPGKVHRVAIQLSYTDSDGKTVRVDPYYDFTLDANGNSVPATGRKMADTNNCNSCHNQLALHGGGRVEVQFCVMCHNEKTVDPDSGNVLEMRTMVHKIHAGRRLHAAGEDYVIWGYGNTAHDYSEVGFPQDLRNCSKCHNATTATPEGDNWKSVPTKQACLTCHQSGNPSAWHEMHINVLRLGTSVDDVSNNCVACHGTGQTWASEQVHWNQNEENAAKYKVVIQSSSYDSATRQVTVKYHVEDPTNANAKWDLNADCTGAVGPNGLPACSSSNRFGNLRLYLAYNNIPGQPVNVTEFSSYNNNGAVNDSAYKGTKDGSNVYTLVLTVPADIPGVTQAKGTGRVLSVGQAKEAELDVVTRNVILNPADTTCGTVAPCFINVSMQNTFKDFAITGSVLPRKEIVSNDKCNACHGLLGTASGSNELNNAFHGGARNTIESCGALCHDAMRPGQYTVMDDDFKFPSTVLGGAGVNNTMNMSHHLKRMIHGIHGGAKTQYDFVHGSRGGIDPDTGDYCLTPENFTAEVAFPGILSDCNACHVNGSFASDRGTIGSGLLSWGTNTTVCTSSYNENAALRPLLLTNVAGTDYVDAQKNPVISPKAASCTSCHDTIGVIQHTQAGGAVFGDRTQGQFLSGFVFESCDGCHAPGGFVGVDAVHNIPLQGPD